ncbi:hypothetical protein A7P92_06535 [Eikenella corrodens]|uniref:gp53-like domain-containing protein n=1 Tax=Eikenella corrodens TaxID=539 RepID=UPI0007D0B456|nr:carbohydrate-binding protein [Eikenella corrodens]OAM23729.1 hypothetical protein A7P92_06535 [Eikenella corrodens]
MAQPNRYEPQAGFAEQTRNNVPGRSPINARALDDELSGISQSINGIVGNLELIQRDDGSLKDATVHLHALGESVLNLMGGFNLRGEWQANTSYAAKDIVDYQGHLFVCMTANQDAAFTAANWHRFGEKGAELHQVLRQVAHMQTQVQEEGRKALQAAAQTLQTVQQVGVYANAAEASEQQAALSAAKAKVSAAAAEQSRISAEAAAASAEGAVNNVSGKLATKLDASVFEEFKNKAATKEELEEKVGGLFTTQLTENGYLKLPNGLVIQWVRINKTIGAISGNYNFPLAFPNKCFGVFCGNQYNGSGSGYTAAAGVVSNATFKILENVLAHVGAGTVAQVFVIAIGH